MNFHAGLVTNFVEVMAVSELLEFIWSQLGEGELRLRALFEG